MIILRTFVPYLSNQKIILEIKQSLIKVMSMKKYLMTGIAALAMGSIFTSCSHDMNQYTGNQSEQVVKNYEQAFVNTYGEPASNQTWGFGETTVAATRGMTRTISVNGDAYDKFPSASDVADYFPTAIPEDADEVSELESLYKGTSVQGQWGPVQMWDLYAIYSNLIKEGYNLKITQAGTTELGGNYQNAGWDNAQGKNVVYPYNVYVDVDGDVTLKRVGATHFNLYILRGNVTIESDYGEQAGLISVAAGATLNDYRNSIAANQGVKLFNRGTINAKNTEKYDIGNFCTVYNEGKFNVTGALTYSPGDTNTSYFMNLGDDAELTAPSMTLNSAGNFFNSGKAVIDGETNVTQKDIYWVNAGHYTTGTMTFSAKNATFYNYCQLLVTGNAHMYDGEFNLMNNSYTEAATAEFDNFIVNMDSNSGINIIGATDWKAQGDGTYQGFSAVDGASGSYVRLGGKATIASHKKTLSISDGITYYIEEIEIKKGDKVVTEQELKDNSDGDYPVLDINGTKAVNLTATPNTNSCGATWISGGSGSAQTVTDSIRVIAEDLNAKESKSFGEEGSDFDFNDVVFDVYWTHIPGNDDKSTQEVKIKLMACGAEFSIYIGSDDDNIEIHDKFAKANDGRGITGRTYTINTQSNRDYNCPEITLLPDSWSGTTIKQVAKSILVRVSKSGTLYELSADEGRAASKIAVGTDFRWCDEWDDIDGKSGYNGKFSEYVGDKEAASKWNTWYK